MRPIPPPPPTPPPGVVYIPQTVVTNAAPPVIAQPNLANIPSTNSPGLEVSSNYVGSVVQPSGSLPTTPGAAAPAVPQAAPQYEVVPPRPGPDYVWRNGYWRWENAWVWTPGEWIYEPPNIIVVPGGGFYYHHYYGGPWRGGRRYRW